MRYSCAALLMLMSSAVTASGQDQATNLAQALEALEARVALAGLAQKPDVRVSPDEMVARLMSFDRNGDGKVATAELSERMQAVVTRGDTGGDGTLDDSEIRALAARRLQFVETAVQNLRRGGGYGFGDTVGLSSRMHILNTITDLRLASAANDEARRIAEAFADELESTALANLRRVVAPLLPDDQLADFEADVKRLGAARTIRVSSNNDSTTQTVVTGAVPSFVFKRHQLTFEQMKTVSAAVETFNAAQQLDEARRSALVTQLRAVLTAEESDNFRAALARRPVVQTAGIVGGVVGGISGTLEAINQLRNALAATAPRP